MQIMKSFFIQKKILRIFKKKSIFGFRILNGKESIISAYFLIFAKIYFQYKFFILGAHDNLGLIAASIFLLISNISIIILVLNIAFQKISFNKYIWLILNLILWIYIPITIINTLDVSKFLYSIIKIY